MHVTETERLRLRHLTAADASFLCLLVNEPSWLEHIGDKGIRTPEDAERFIQEKYEAAYRTLGFGMYLVESKEDRRPMGVCGLVKRDGLDTPDLGFALLPEFEGKGYAYEAASALMEHAWTVLGLTRLVAVATPANHRSDRLLERLGFRLAGMIRILPGGEELRLYETAAPVPWDRTPDAGEAAGARRAGDP